MNKNIEPQIKFRRSYKKKGCIAPPGEADRVVNANPRIQSYFWKINLSINQSNIFFDAHIQSFFISVPKSLCRLSMPVTSEKKRSRRKRKKILVQFAQDQYKLGISIRYHSARTTSSVRTTMHPPLPPPLPPPAPILLRSPPLPSPPLPPVTPIFKKSQKSSYFLKTSAG